MRFIPGIEWTWGYAAQPDGSTALTMHIMDHTRVRYIFTTHFADTELRILPQDNQPLEQEDLRDLQIYKQGLAAIGVSGEEIALPLAINSLACEHFVKLPQPCGQYFLSYSSQKNKDFRRGEVVSLYGKNGVIGDFMVLDDQPQPTSPCRLMLLNSSMPIGDMELRLGAMICVPLSRICHFREISMERLQADVAADNQARYA